MKTYIQALLVVLMAAPMASAGGVSKVAVEIIEFWSKKGAKEVVEHGVEKLAQRLETLAVKHGGDQAIYSAVRKVGPRGLQLIEESGGRALQTASLLAKHGEAGIVQVLARPNAVSLVGKLGEEAAEVLVRHPGAIAEPLLEKAGAPAVKAFASLNAQSGRRLAMLAEGESSKLIQQPGMLDCIARVGDRGMDFVYRNWKPLLLTGAAASFIASPEAYLNGAEKLATVAAVNIAKPLAEMPGRVAERAVENISPEIGRNTNWTLVILFLIAGGFGAIVLIARHRTARLTRYGQ